MAVSEPTLHVEQLAVRYGRMPALKGASLRVRAGEAVALLGANGSGKTTLLNAICGFVTPSEGRVSLADLPITGLPPHQIFARGIVQVSQGRDLFGSMSVHDNLLLGARYRRRPGPDMDEIFGYFPRLAERRDQIVRTLSGGEQQMVAMGRALMSAPHILLLDEPSAGLAPRFVQEIGAIINRLKAAQRTMLLVEQNLSLAASVADRFYVLRNGTTVAEGDGDELRSDRRAFARTHYL